MTPARDIAEYDPVPYILDVRAVERDDGEWVCRAEYEELPGCVAEDVSAVVALEQVEVVRRRYIQQAIAEGRPLPVPRLRLHDVNARFGGEAC
jgi:hypothetical protein